MAAACTILPISARWWRQPARRPLRSCTLDGGPQCTAPGLGADSSECSGQRRYNPGNAPPLRGDYPWPSRPPAAIPSPRRRSLPPVSAPCRHCSLRPSSAATPCRVGFGRRSRPSSKATTAKPTRVRRLTMRLAWRSATRSARVLTSSPTGRCAGGTSSRASTSIWRGWRPIPRCARSGCTATTPRSATVRPRSSRCPRGSASSRSSSISRNTQTGRSRSPAPGRSR